MVVADGHAAEDRLDKIAAGILAARLTPAPLGALALAGEIDGVEAAYAVQLRVATLAAGVALGRPAGYKIGLSGAASQQSFRVSEPVSGRIFVSRIYEAGATLPIGLPRRMGVECEVAVRLGRDLQRNGTAVTPDEAACAVKDFHVGIEILEDRFDRAADASVWAIAADDVFGFGAVLGPPLDGFDPFRARDGMIAVDGEEKARGSTGNLQGGGPMATLAWLANRLAQSGDRLRAGEIVFSGGLSPPVWLGPERAGDRVVMATLDGVGEPVDLRMRWSPDPAEDV